MKQSMLVQAGLFGVFILHQPAAYAACPTNTVRVGPVCVDKHEVSVWNGPTATVRNKIRAGTVTLGDLQTAGATQFGATADDYPCSDNANNCKNKIFALSIPGVLPSTHITWFQAQQACANANERLLINAEWQMAAAGTPDGAPCNVSSGAASPTGTPGCVSVWGAFDMVGNVTEWVADWIQGNHNPWAPVSGTTESGLYGNDFMDGINPAQAGPGSVFPAALHRGGDFNSGTTAGVFALSAGNTPSNAGGDLGFRCGRLF